MFLFAFKFYLEVNILGNYEVGYFLDTRYLRNIHEVYWEIDFDLMYPRDYFKTKVAMHD